MTDHRVVVLAAAKQEMRFGVPDNWDGEWEDAVRGSFRYFADDVIGASVATLMPSMEQLSASAPSADGRVRTFDGGKDVWLQFQAADGAWFAAKWSDRPAKREGDAVRDVSFAKLDPENLDYPYPARIGSATVMTVRGQPAVRASCQLGNFGDYADAIEALADLSGHRRRENAAAEGPSSPHLVWDDLLSLDGGIAGQASREVADDIAQVAADRIMHWAGKLLPRVVEALKAENCVFGNRMLRFNDLDNYVALAEDGGRQALFHCNISYISEFRTYVLVRDGDDISLHALKSGTDDFARAMEAFRAGTALPCPVASIRGGEVSRGIAFDSTGVLDAMAHGLKFTAEIVLNGDRGDADYSEDFSYLDTRGEDEEPSGPALPPGL